MSILEFMLANQIWARRHRDKKPYPLYHDLPGKRAIAVRLAAMLAVFAMSILLLEVAGDRYGSTTVGGSTVAASRQ
ncbi:hypothetical protein [Rhizobium sp. Root1220]|uniref:hypothetical protein n=1 Tax=Rhizobium sp. Root1220 TaxID=1736432 RepID=UPI0006F53745|nr:hypothetical protein [Rhizobium sp. Root1220]KQV63874.1 hypothetical protein ASC90_18070 [Rhizobium sp. Root1220]